jgi:hypothetical protein
MAYIAVIERGEHVIPVLKGGDGLDAECMKVWGDYETACREAGEVPMAKAYLVSIIDLDDAR